ncbi:hypothetical protein ACOSP7_021420 [Xanthoceras sorbifolium]
MGKSAVFPKSGVYVEEAKTKALLFGITPAVRKDVFSHLKVESPAVRKDVFSHLSVRKDDSADGDIVSRDE